MGKTHKFGTDFCAVPPHSSLAQSVEHLTVNQGVTGSSPVILGFLEAGTMEQHRPSLASPLTFPSFHIEGKWSVTNESTTTYTKFGVSGWFIAAVAYAIHSGDISMLERSVEYAK